MTTAIATSPSIADVIRLVQRSRLDLSSEKHLQEGVAEVLQGSSQKTEFKVR